MKIARKALSLMLALILTLAVFPAAQADTTVKSSHGAFAAEVDALGRLFMILPTDTGSSLYSMPENGGAVTLIESAQQINDLVAADDGSVYYLRYNGEAFQAIVRQLDGTRIELASFQPGQLAYSLSYYDGALFCLVDNKLTRIISAPGVALQHLTVFEPDDDMIECAIAAMTKVIPEDGSDQF